MKLERYEDALTSIEQSLKLKANFSGACNIRGFALDELGRYDQAIASYDKAIEFQRENSDAWYNQGIVLMKLECFEEAIACNERAIEFQHDYPQAWCNLGTALMNLGRFEEALASFDRSLKFQRDLPEAWYNRANTLLSLKRFEEALTSYDKYDEIRLDDSDTFYGKACCYAQLLHIEQAVFNLRQAINLSHNQYHKSIIKDTLRQRQEADICTDWALLHKLSRKRLLESLQNAGFKSPTIESYILAWECFQEPRARVYPNFAALPSFWEFVNGTAITVDNLRLVLVPTLAMDEDELRVPQEWVDIPGLLTITWQYR